MNPSRLKFYKFLSYLRDERYRFRLQAVFKMRAVWVRRHSHYSVSSVVADLVRSRQLSELVSLQLAVSAEPMTMHLSMALAAMLATLHLLESHLVLENQSID